MDPDCSEMKCFQGILAEWTSSMITSMICLSVPTRVTPDTGQCSDWSRLLSEASDWCTVTLSADHLFSKILI